MDVRLLYPDREWKLPEYYFDYQNISKDLGLQSLFLIASKDVVYERYDVKRITDPDLYIKEVFQKIVLTPCKTPEEIYYRQAVIKDAFENEKMINELYDIVSKMLSDWNVIGRHLNSKSAGRDNQAKLVARIHEFSLFTKTLDKIRYRLHRYRENFYSEGLKSLADRLCDEYSEEVQRTLREILETISFYIIEPDMADPNPTEYKPRIVIECGIGGGSKFSDIKLVEAETVTKKFRDPKSAIAKVQGMINARTPNSVSAEGSRDADKQADLLEYNVVKYLMSFAEPFMSSFEDFFDKLKFQLAFYKGAINLKHHMKRFSVEYCFPRVTEKNRLAYDDLKEFVMCIEQQVEAVGNTGTIDPKMLIIITGANQGGKSTFLRSVGIAQVMMQCGLMVPAKSFESGLFPSLFMHFTRREDVEMNSGRLDEELGRMDQIINNLGPDSLVLLNESFATTTERDGSIIAYDIIKALNEAGVKIITVTHLLSFAQRVYSEVKEIEDKGGSSDITFFCAERRPNGQRTFKIIQNVPELTSFGLDLYEDIIEKRG